MRTIIKITKQEAIDAWKQQNCHLSLTEGATVEIEEVKTLSGSTTTTIPWNPYNIGISPNC